MYVPGFLVFQEESRVGVVRDVDGREVEVGTAIVEKERLWDIDVLGWDVCVVGVLALDFHHRFLVFFPIPP